MKAILQRVSSAEVKVADTVIGQIEKGYLILLGVEEGDTQKEAALLAAKTAALRVFSDENDKMNLSVIDVEGAALVVSNFTLCADSRKGKRPSFEKAAPPKEANELYEKYCELLKADGVCKVETGQFGADMKVSLLNDGPVTIILDTKELRPSSALC